MKAIEFDKLAREYFGEVLKPYGFSAEKSQYCTFYRQVGELYHVVMPDLNSDGTSFIIRVFVTSSLIEPNFDERFPDNVGIPSDVCSALHPRRGVSFRAHNYRCKSEEGFIRNFNTDAKPALLEKALPYLDEITSVQDMLPSIKNQFYLAVATWQSGNKEEAKPLLESECKRLSDIDDKTGQAASSLSFLEGLLAGSA